MDSPRRSCFPDVSSPTTPTRTHCHFHPQDKKNPHATFWRIQPIVMRFVQIVIRFAQIPGRSAELAKKWHEDFSRVLHREFPEQQNFKRLKNCEDSSDFDDSWTESIASARSSSRRKNFSVKPNNFAANERT